MFIITEPLSIDKLRQDYTHTNGFVKGVIDIKQEIIALDAEMHYELAEYLTENCQSAEIDMWGFNLWLNNDTFESILEYDSLINIHNNQLHGFPRGGMDIKDKDIENKSTEIITRWITA